MKKATRSRRFLTWLLAGAMSLSLTAPALAASPDAGPSPSPELTRTDPAAGESTSPEQPSAAPVSESAAPSETPVPSETPAPSETPQPSAPPEPEGPTYVDVPNDAWYTEAVYYCLENALMLGVSEEKPIFAPEDHMTRATLATVLYRIEGEPKVTAANPFQDVQTGTWYSDAVLWANNVKIMLGYGNGLFGVADPVTREEMTTILWRYAGSPAPKGTGAGYSDQGDVASWAATGAAWAQEQEIVHTDPAELFAPQTEVKRCEIAWALMKFDKNQTDSVPDPWAEFEAEFGYRPEEKDVTANPYVSENFKVLPNEAGASYMTYQGGSYAVGIDISSWQKNVDWKAVAASGVQFVMLRVGFRGYGSGAINRDSYFTQNIEGALAAGLQVGVYFFSQAVTIEEALDEAQYTIKMIQNYNITYPVVFDWERQSADTSRTKNTSNETIVACAVAFCETVKAAGYIPMFYASPSKAYKLDMGYVADYPFWLAHYTAYQVPSSYKYDFDMWQYSSKWQVPGVSGDCDVNICLTNWDEWRAANQSGGG